jgi:hypothetical protein
MTDVFVESPAEPTRDRNQVIAAILLGLAATLTAFSAYLGSLEDGESLQGYTASTRTLSDANTFYAEANQVFALDQQLFLAHLTADLEGNDLLANYLIESVMRPELAAAVEWFYDTDEARTPFDDIEGNPWELAQQADAIHLEQLAAAQFEEGAAANEAGDRFQLATVLFALTLFFGGVATLFGRATITHVLLGLALVTVVFGAAVLVTAF